jgi:hypothetical protein
MSPRLDLPPGSELKANAKQPKSKLKGGEAIPLKALVAQPGHVHQL